MWTGRVARFGFFVSVQGSDVLMYWAPLHRCNASIFLDRVQFLTVGDQLAGVVFRGLSVEQLQSFVTHAEPRHVS
jgi:hypothetical protein